MAYTEPTTILSLYREVMDDIRAGRNDSGYVMDMLHRIAIHPGYNNQAFGLLGSRIVKEHIKYTEGNE